MKNLLQKKLSAFIVPIAIGMMFSASANAQIVNIPDANFKAALVNNAAINTNGDGEIQVAEAAAYSGTIGLYNMGIFDLTGIEAFTALDSLSCLWNGLTSLNVSACTALTYLVCSFNSLTSLNVTGNTALTYLHCDINQLPSLNVSACTALTYLNCDHNNLTSLNVTANTALTYLNCRNNSLTSLNVTTNTALTELRCPSNSLTCLNVSANTALTYLNCSSNQLTSLNVQNGNNSNFTNFNATNNPNLNCIQVDSVAYSNANWSAGKDAIASFSTNCGATSVHDFDNSSTVQFFPNPANNYVTLALGSINQKVEVTITDITGKIIYSTTASDTQKIEVNTNDFAEGIYVIQIQTADFIETKKLVIEK